MRSLLQIPLFVVRLAFFRELSVNSSLTLTGQDLLEPCAISSPVDVYESGSIWVLDPNSTDHCPNLDGESNHSCCPTFEDPHELVSSLSVFCASVNAPRLVILFDSYSPTWLLHARRRRS